MLHCQKTGILLKSVDSGKSDNSEKGMMEFRNQRWCRIDKREDSNALVTIDGEGVDCQPRSGLMLYHCGVESDSERWNFNGGPVAFGGSKGYITGKGGLACLIAKATSDESNKWHRRLGHVNFKNLNKLVKGNLVREFKNKDIIELCGSKGIKREYSNARTPQQNRVAERKNKTLIEAARTMLADSFLPNHFFSLKELVLLVMFSNRLDKRFKQHYIAGQQKYSSCRMKEKKSKRGKKKSFLDELERLKRQEKEANKEAEALRKEFAQETENLIIQEGAAKASSTNIFSTVSTPAKASSITSLILVSFTKIPPLEDIYQNSSDGNLFYFILMMMRDAVDQKPLVKDEEASDVDVHLYRSMIGSLMYLTASRPDIMFAVSKGKPKLGLWYPRVSSFDLESYSDSDYARANLDRKSTTGGCQFLGRRLISWQCKKQTIVATSTTEEIYAYEEETNPGALKSHTDDNVADLLTWHLMFCRLLSLVFLLASIRSDLLFDDVDGIDSHYLIRLYLVLLYSLWGNEGGMTYKVVYDLCLSLCAQIIVSAEELLQETKDTQESWLKDIERTDRPRKLLRHPKLKTQKLRNTALYEKIKRSDEDFISIGSVEDERLIKKMNEKGIDSFTSEVIKEENGDYLVIYSANGNFKAFNYLLEVLHIFDRQDLFHLYDLVMNLYSKVTLEGIELILWGDLKILMESSKEENDQSDFWNNQQNWEIVTWRLYKACGVYILELKDGTVIHMLVERRYPLSKDLMQRMLDFRLEVEIESTVVFDLIRFIKQQLNEE
ncbi:uncharacterized mitochondrial protein-like protein [Tanacetum coccineum]